MSLLDVISHVTPALHSSTAQLSLPSVCSLPDYHYHSYHSYHYQSYHYYHYYHYYHSVIV